MMQDPGRVIKGKKMPGQMGSAKVKVRNLKVIEANPEKNLLVVRGAVPGANGTYLTVEEKVCKDQQASVTPFQGITGRGRNGTSREYRTRKQQGAASAGGRRVPITEPMEITRAARPLRPGQFQLPEHPSDERGCSRIQQGRMRRGTASTKSRGEINGSPRKPWRQKGTGRARSGSKKSPIWRGGEIVFGPRPRSYDYGLSRKQRRLPLATPCFPR